MSSVSSSVLRDALPSSFKRWMRSLMLFIYEEFAIAKIFLSCLDFEIIFRICVCLFFHIICLEHS